MADYHPLNYIPWGFDPSLPILPPYQQDFVITPGYGWIPGPMIPIMPFQFDLAFLSPSYCRAYAFFLQPYADHYPAPPPAPPLQPANDSVHMGIPLLPGLPVAPMQPPYLLPLQVVAASGTGVFHPHPLVNNDDNNAYRRRRRRGYATGRWRRKRHEREEASRNDTEGSSTQNNTGTASSSQERKTC